ncbi:uncharacterized protein [Clytia hemisphaerica]|uniref:RING-type domain-containing protein n=1 Tax=Clytia hemisphaerica TaxID=252671 RepID=A0A7M5WUY3_9CNID
MASNKQQIEIEEQQSLGACAIPGDSTQCSICMAPLKEDSVSNKCKQCVKKMNSVPAGFPFETAGPDRKEFECAICLCIIRNATELPCEHLMCKECLEHYEKEQISQAERDGKNKEAEFFCSVCITKYDVNSKTPVKSVDRMAQTTVSVKCLQKDCDWIGCIKDYVGHEKKCRFIVVQCPYFDIGCLTNIYRGKLEEHNLKEKPKHDSLLLNTVSSLVKERIVFQQKIDDQDIRIGRLGQENVDLKKKVQKQESVIKDNARNIERIEEEKSHLNRYISEQKNTIQDFGINVDMMKKENLEKTSELKAIDIETKRNGNTISSLKQDLQIQKKKSSSLEKFAEQMSLLHKTLSQPRSWFGKYTTALVDAVVDANYEDHNGASEWFKFIDDCYKSEDECSYLKIFREALNRYENVIYPKNWSSLLNHTCLVLNVGKVIDYVVLLPANPMRKISMTLAKSQEEFNTITKQEKWCKYSEIIAYYRDWDRQCLYVITYLPIALKTIWLLDQSKKDKRRELPINGEIVNLQKGNYIQSRVLIQFERA